ncbi:MAG: NTP transferase domain-containing protein [Armatimonadota bacterium]
MSVCDDAVGVVLAGGRGTRFVSSGAVPGPKILQELAGRPLIAYVLDVLREAGIGRIVVIVGYCADELHRVLGGGVEYAYQDVQLGSGHALMCASELLRGVQAPVVVMCGDSPLFRASTVRAMVETQYKTGCKVVLAGAVLDDPSGYGRIVRDGAGRVVRIVEESCASELERGVREVNGGAYVFWTPWLVENMSGMRRNEAGEYNLTDMVRIACERGEDVCVVDCEPDEVLGVNTPYDLERAERVLRSRGL